MGSGVTNVIAVLDIACRISTPHIRKLRECVGHPCTGEAQVSAQRTGTNVGHQAPSDYCPKCAELANWVPLGTLLGLIRDRKDAPIPTSPVRTMEIVSGSGTGAA